MQALRLLSETEGIIPAIESAHALAGALRIGRELGPDAILAICLSGRGDKDMDTAAATSSCTTRAVARGRRIPSADEAKGRDEL
jgi:tryptophan synthase beta chain